MKYRLLAVSKYAETTKKIGVNIGDYIQALASSQFYPHIDGFIDRDKELNRYDGEECKVIMNGWYMHEPMNWPPSQKIVPLFVAFHLNSVAREELLSEESISYLKAHQPIGCRDITTMELLQQKDVDAYFSACMTLTLGHKYQTDKKNDKTYIVDPVYDCDLSISLVLNALIILSLHPFDIFRLLKKKRLDLQHGRNFIKKLLKTALYYKEYSRVFGRSIVMDSEYVYQDNDDYLEEYEDDFSRLKKAEELVRMYSKARFVITSRIHCALPCLGLDTPVVYLDRAKDSETSACRLNGLKELFNSVSLNNGILSPCFETKLPIDIHNIPSNKKDWKKYALSLIDKCKAFMQDDTL